MIYPIPTALTFLNIIFACIALYGANQGNTMLAVIGMILAVIFDYLDGHIARKLNQTSEFGMHIDTVADMVSFGVVPALILFFHSGESLLTGIASIFFIICTAFRLARFNATASQKTSQSQKTKHYQGLPSTTSGIIIPIFLLIDLLLTFPQLPEGFGIELFILITLGILMISTLKIPKL